MLFQNVILLFLFMMYNCRCSSCLYASIWTFMSFLS